MSRRRIRVLYLDHVGQLSGAEIALARVLPELRRDVDELVVLAEDGPFVGLLREVGARVEVLPLAAGVRYLRRDRVLGRDTAQAAWSTVRYVLAIRRLIRRERIDLVHTNTLKPALYGGLAGRLAGVPVIWHVRDRYAADYLSARTTRLVRAAARVLPTAVIANSASTASTVPRRSSVVHDSVVVNAPTAVRRPQHPTVVGMAGRLAPWKGQEEFLRAFAAACAGTDVQAAVIGSALFGEDEYATRLERLAAELGISDQVDFRGFRGDMVEEYARLDVLVHYSLSPEPFGQVVAEGMAAGLCVLAAAEGGPAELVRDGVDGVLVAPRDVGALAAALRRWSADEPGRRRLGAAARTASAGRTPRAAADAIMAVYREVLASRG